MKRPGSASTPPALLLCLGLILSALLAPLAPLNGPGLAFAADAPAHAVELREKPYEPQVAAQAASQPTTAASPQPSAEAAKPKAKPGKASAAKSKDKQAKSAKQAKPARQNQAEALLGRQAPGQSKVSADDLAAPYSASPRFMGPPAPPRSKDDPAQANAPGQKGQQNQAANSQSNATGTYDPTPKKGPFAQDPNSPISFHFGREQVTDPITGREVTKTDPTGAKDSLKSGDLKGAADKLGGKAEVQVDILKF